MLTLYYSPGACSMASHITLEEAGAQYTPQQILTSKGEQRSPEYLKINPRGKVPALKLDDGSVLTENVAILIYLARSFPDKKLVPDKVEDAVKGLSHMAWFSNTVHPTFAHIVRPERFTKKADGADGVKEAAKETYWGCMQEIDSILAGKQWMLGDQFTVCDPYALVFYGWGGRVGLPMAELKNYTAHKDRLLKRPAVQKVLQREESPLLKAA
jgi:glutathione S-transferase